MGFLPSSEQLELADGVRRFLSDVLPMARVRAVIANGGFDAPAWSALAGQLDVLGLAVPVGVGGAGGGYCDQALVAQEIGAALCPLPYLSTVGLAVPLLSALAPAARDRWLPGILDGSVRAALGVRDVGAGEWSSSTTMLARPAPGDTVRLHGSKTFVLDGAEADVVFVLARSESGAQLFAVDPTASGATRRPLTTLDPSRPMAEIHFDGCVAEPLGAEASALNPVYDLGRVILAMEQVGAARRCLEMSTAYARTRAQFGRKIGSFQAIKHRCAEMFVAVESARVAGLHAAWTADFAPAELSVAAAAAKALASEALLLCAKQNIQIHGGIGVTAEHDAHLYYRRAQASNLLFGSPTVLSRRLADLLDLAPVAAS